MTGNEHELYIMATKIFLDVYHRADAEFESYLALHTEDFKYGCAGMKKTRVLSGKVTKARYFWYTVHFGKKAAASVSGD